MEVIDEILKQVYNDKKIFVKKIPQSFKYILLINNYWLFAWFLYNLEIYAPVAQQDRAAVS